MAVAKVNGVWTIRGKIKKDDGTYYNYKRVVPDAKKKSDAQACEVDFKRQYQDIQLSKKRISFSDLIEEYQLRPREIKTSSLQTDKDIFEKVCKKIGAKKINLITKDTLQKYITELETKYSKEYVKKYYYTINKVFEYAIEQEYLISNPMKKVKRSKYKDELRTEMLFWEPSHFEKFISVVDDIDLEGLFKFLYYMGTRKGETIALQWKDIDLSHNTASIYKTVTLKSEGKAWDITSPKTSNSNRNITMPKVVVDAINKINDAHKNYYGYNSECFVFGFSRPMSYESLRRKFKKFIDLANLNADDQIPIIRIHDLRHSHASYLINNMSDRFTDFDIAKRLGDTVQTLHSTYAHWFKQADQGIIDFMDNDIKK